MYKISNHGIHIFQISVKKYISHIDEFIPILSDNEVKRISRFRLKADQHVFIISHGILRTLLGYYLNIEPKKVQFGENLYGKPEIKSPKTNLYFNLSHSAGFILLAFSKKPIGIDIEVINRDISFDDIVAQFFSENEYQEYQSLPNEQRLLGFYQAWTRKEAYVKALGKGLACPLQHFSITLTPGQPAKIYEICNDNIKNWHIHSFVPHENYCAAVAWKGNQKNLVFLECNI